MVYCITLGLVRDQVLALKNCERTIEVSATALIYLVRSVQWSCSLYYLSNLSQKTSVAKKKTRVKKKPMMLHPPVLGCQYLVHNIIYVLEILIPNIIHSSEPDPYRPKKYNVCHLFEEMSTDRAASSTTDSKDCRQGHYS